MDATYAAAIASFEVASAMASRPLPPWAPNLANVAVTAGVAVLLVLASAALFLEARARASVASRTPHQGTVVSSTLVESPSGVPSHRVFQYEWSDPQGTHRASGSAPVDALGIEAGSRIRVWKRSGPMQALFAGGVPEPALATYESAWRAFVGVGAALLLACAGVASLAARDVRRREVLANAPLQRGQVVSTEVINPRVKPRLAVVAEWPGGRMRHVFPANANPSHTLGFVPRVGDEAWVAVSGSDPSWGLPWSFARRSGLDDRSER